MCICIKICMSLFSFFHSLHRSAYTTLTLNNPLDHEVMFAYLQTETHFVVIGIDNGTVSCKPFHIKLFSWHVCHSFFYHQIQAVIYQ